MELHVVVLQMRAADSRLRPMLAGNICALAQLGQVSIPLPLFNHDRQSKPTQELGRFPTPRP